MSWIKTISYSEASEPLRSAYEQVKGDRERVDNVMTIHSLRPHTMEAHFALYRAVLHSPDNALPAWFLEALGVYTSMVNDCHYSVAHHFEGLRRALADDGRAEQIREALFQKCPENVFSGKELALLRYAERLTRSPDSMREEDVSELKRAGASDGEILETNQVTAYFNYANRVLNGLGVTTEGDVLGTSPRSPRE